MNITTLSVQVGYANSSLHRSVGYQPDDPDEPESFTGPLPVRYEAVIAFDGTPVAVTLLVDAFEDDGTEEVRVGVRTVEVTTATGGGPVSADRLRRVQLRALLVDAVQRWSTNSDGSEVTTAQASSIVRSSASRLGAAQPENRQREAATAWLDAYERREPTAVAVARALRLGTGKKGQDNARQYVHRARVSGVFEQVERERAARP